MKNPILPLFAALLGCALWADLALPHGGSFRGPNGGVPPGLREPSDPVPPPPPPSEPGDPGNPTTPPGGVPGAVTPHDTPSDTPGGGIPPPTLGGKQGKRRGRRTPSLTFESWRFWWAYNKDDILNLKSHVVTGGTTSGGFFPFGQSGPGGNRRSLMRPTQRAIEREILPALLETANHPGNHQDIHGAALIALAKAGASDRIGHFRDVLHNQYVNPQGRRIDFGYQATESAVLALGLLPDLDEANREVVRGICLEAVADESLRTRERAWAAVSLGLQRDRKAVRPLMTLLTKKYPDDNVPAGILAGIGLIGDGSVLPELVEIIVRERFAGIRMSPRLQAFAGYAISKIGDPAFYPPPITATRVPTQPRNAPFPHSLQHQCAPTEACPNRATPRGRLALSQPLRKASQLHLPPSTIRIAWMAAIQSNRLFPQDRHPLESTPCSPCPAETPLYLSETTLYLLGGHFGSMRGSQPDPTEPPQG